MSSRIAKRRTRAVSPVGTGLSFERIPKHKRPRTHHLTSLTSHHTAPGRTSSPIQSATSVPRAELINPAPLESQATAHRVATNPDNHPGTLFTFTKLLQEELDAIPALQDNHLDGVGRLNQVDEDVENVLLNQPSAGKVWITYSWMQLEA